MVEGTLTVYFIDNLQVAELVTFGVAIKGYWIHTFTSNVGKAKENAKRWAKRNNVHIGENL